MSKEQFELLKIRGAKLVAAGKLSPGVYYNVLAMSYRFVREGRPDVWW